MTSPAVGGIVDNDGEALRGKRFQKAAQIARIQPQPLAKPAQFASVRADFEQQARLTERPPTAELTAVERAGAQRHQTVEAADAFDLGMIHSLTLVR